MLRLLRFPSRPVVLALLIVLIVVGGVGSYELWSGSSSSPQSASLVTFDKGAYRPGDTIHFTIHGLKYLPAHSRWTLDYLCSYPNPRDPLWQALMQVQLSRNGEVYTFPPGQRRKLHLSPGTHVLCVYDGNSILGTGTFRLVG